MPQYLLSLFSLCLTPNCCLGRPSQTAPAGGVTKPLPFGSLDSARDRRGSDYRHPHDGGAYYKATEDLSCTLPPSSWAGR